MICSFLKFSLLVGNGETDWCLQDIIFYASCRPKGGGEGGADVYLILDV